MKKSIILFIILSFNTGFVFSQSRKTIEELQQQYQQCLDKGEFMWECSRSFYGQMDSMLNIAYRNLLSKLGPTQKALLKQEQRDWLKKRDAYFRKTYGEAAKDGNILAKDNEMIMYDSNADYVKVRVLYMINRLEKTNAQ